MTNPKLLANVDPEHYFYVNDGTVIRNIYDLNGKLVSIDEQTFGHHITDDRNDFQNWVRDVLEDYQLAEELGLTKSREVMLEAINRRIQEERFDQESEVKGTGNIEAAAAPEHVPETLEPVASEAQSKSLDSIRHMNSGLLDFLGGLALGVIIGLFIGKLLL